MRTRAAWLIVAAAAVLATAAAPAALNPVKFAATPAGEPLVLVRAGQAQASIVVAKAALTAKNSPELRAAKELQEHVRLATGAELPIKPDAAAPTGPHVLIGESALTAGHDLSPAGLAPEGFRIQTVGTDLAILGSPGVAGVRGSDLGVLFGVYDLLERYLGVRWYYPGEDGRSILPRSDFIVPQVCYHDAPLRTLRVQLSGSGDPALYARYRAGGSSPIRINCHTPLRFGTLKDHPDCLELDRSGNRNPGMPCYGNPKTAELFVQDVANFYEKGEKTPWLLWDNQTLWGPPTDQVISISPPDKGIGCECEYCRKLFDPAADAHGRASRILCEYVTRVANAVKRRWPDKQVYYLPYLNYTLPPAGVTLPDNVVVCVCLMYGVNDKEPAVAAAHDQMIRGWAAATGRQVYLWTYPCWPVEDSTLPFQYPHVLQEFEQRHRNTIAGEGLCGDYFAAQTPTMYCWFRLLWNPDFDVAAALAEFVERMYGPAREPMSRIYDSLTRRWEQTRWQQPLTSWHVSPRQIHEETMPRAEALKLRDWLAEARRLAAEGSVERRRLEFFGAALEKFLTESDRYHDGGGLAELRLLKVSTDPVPDGKLDEPCWRDAESQPFKMALDRQNPVPAHGTTVQAVWTAQGVSLAFRLAEPELGKLRARCTAHDSDVYSDDCVELFLDVTGQRSGYYQLAINSLGTVFDRWSQDESWNAAGLKAGVAKGEAGWTLEVFLPYRAFPDCQPPRIGSIWYGNLTRSRTVDKFAIQRWNTLFEPSNLSFNAFGKLRFVE